jgi:hypothetical protein
MLKYRIVAPSTSRAHKYSYILAPTLDVRLALNHDGLSRSRDRMREPERET